MSHLAVTSFSEEEGNTIIELGMVLGNQEAGKACQRKTADPRPAILGRRETRGRVHPIILRDSNLDIGEILGGP